MFMPYYKEHVGYTAKDILEDLELLFRHVDYIVAYRILGGEPLINNELEDMIKQIGIFIKRSEHHCHLLRF